MVTLKDVLDKYRNMSNFVDLVPEVDMYPKVFDGYKRIRYKIYMKMNTMVIPFKTEIRITPTVAGEIKETDKAVELFSNYKCDLQMEIEAEFSTWLTNNTEYDKIESEQFDYRKGILFLKLYKKYNTTSKEIICENGIGQKIKDKIVIGKYVKEELIQ